MTFREERTELVSLLDSLKCQRDASHRKEMYDTAIKQTRRKVLGLYRQVMNSRKVDIAPKEEIIV